MMYASTWQLLPQLLLHAVYNLVLDSTFLVAGLSTIHINNLEARTLQELQTSRMQLQRCAKQWVDYTYTGAERVALLTSTPSRHERCRWKEVSFKYFMDAAGTGCAGYLYWRDREGGYTGRYLSRVRPKCPNVDRHIHDTFQKDCQLWPDKTSSLRLLHRPIKRRQRIWTNIDNFVNGVIILCRCHLVPILNLFSFLNKFSFSFILRLHCVIRVANFPALYVF